MRKLSPVFTIYGDRRWTHIICAIFILHITMTMRNIFDIEESGNIFYSISLDLIVLDISSILQNNML